MRYILSLSVLTFSIFALACGQVPEENVNSSNTSQITNTRIQNVDANNLPPGLSGSPVVTAANNAGPGIPANANIAARPLEKGTTPTPGIPDPKDAVMRPKPGATPTPGIPDPETLKRQMEQMRKAGAANVNQRPPGAEDGMMMRKKPRMVNSNN